MTPPSYLISGTGSGAVRPRMLSAASMKLEYGDGAWLLAEHRRFSPAAPNMGSLIVRSVATPLRSVARAVVSIFL